MCETGFRSLRGNSACTCCNYRLTAAFLLTSYLSKSILLFEYFNFSLNPHLFFFWSKTCSSGDILRGLLQWRQIIPSCRFRRRAGLLHVPRHHAPAAPAGGARAWDPGGPEDGRQGGERLCPGLGAPSQADSAGREANRPGRWEPTASWCTFLLFCSSIFLRLLLLFLYLRESGLDF